MKRLNQYKKRLFLLTTILVIVVTVGGFLYASRTPEKRASVFYINGIALNARSLYPVKKLQIIFRQKILKTY